MNRLAATTALLALLVGGAALADTPRKVVSLDYCADQFVLKLLPRDRISGGVPGRPSRILLHAPCGRWAYAKCGQLLKMCWHCSLT